MPISRNSHKTTRCTVRRQLRNLNRRGLRGRRRGPDDLAQACTAFGRVIRAHRRLARLAPRFFDSAVVDREVLNRAEQRRWQTLWEPALAKAYGVNRSILIRSRICPRCRPRASGRSWNANWPANGAGWRRAGSL